MKLLLDTCTFLWAVGDTDRLSSPAREALENSDNILILHQISAWEIQIKAQSGKLKLFDTPRAIIHSGLRLYGIRYETFDDAAIWHMSKLPEYHKDPFDRILISSALVGGMQMVTPDRNIHRYPIPVIW